MPISRIGIWTRTSRRLKKSTSFVLASFRPSTGTRPPHHSAARTDLVLLIRRTVRPRGYACGFDLPAALFGKRRVSARQGWAGEKSGLFEPPAGVICGHSSIGAESSAISIQLSAPDGSQSSALGPEPCISSFNIHNSTFPEGGTASGLTPHALRSSSGFTILEIIIVLFLLVGLLGIILPRISLDDSLGTVGRRLVGTVRSLQSLAMLTQKTVRLYVDMDRGVYWPVILDGNQEKIPLDPIWATPLKLSETIRISDFLAGQGKKESGRVDLSFYPTGRIDPATIHLMDAKNNILAIAIEPVTGAIRMSDERIEPPRPLTILDRVKPLLKTAEAVK